MKLIALGSSNVVSPAAKTPARRTWAVPCLALLIAVGTSACGGNNSLSSGSGAAGGTQLDQPGTDPTILSKTLSVDPNHGGEAQALKIVRVSWGRLVDVVDENRDLQQKDMVIPETIGSDNINYELSTELGTERNVLRVLHPAGTPEYDQAYESLRISAFSGLTAVSDKGIDPSELPPFSLVPRNAAIVIQFDDLVDPDRINGSTVKITTGYPPTASFEPRVIRDQNHGDLLDTNGDGVLEFYTTRVILDTTISALESSQSNPPLQTNPFGLPGSQTTNSPNVAVRIPTKTDLDNGQLEILENLNGNPVNFGNNGSVDPNSPTQDVIRAVRSGGEQNVTGDLYNGFLKDLDPPMVTTTLPVVIANVQLDPLHPGGFTAALTFTLASCSMKLAAGTLIVNGVSYYLVTEDTDLPPASVIDQVRFRPVLPNSPALPPGQAQVLVRLDDSVPVERHPCFVRFTNINTPPTTNVLTTSKVLIRFNEAMNPGTITPFDNFAITRIPAPPLFASSFVIGQLDPLEGLKAFQFTPVLPFKHTAGSPNDTYYIRLASGPTGPTDLAGNPLVFPLSTVPFKIEPTEPPQNNGGYALRFSSVDEYGSPTAAQNPGQPDGFNEWRGQFLLEAQAQRLRPRPVTRFSAVADRTQTLPGLMPSPGFGVQTPLSSFGSKMQTIWRYCDFGFSLLDESNTNVDIEGMAWAPVGGSAVADIFGRFEIALGHSNRLPDESVNATTLLPVYPNSGLVPTFGLNVLDDQSGSPLHIVHPRVRGYIVNPADLFPATTGTLMLPYPLNRGLPVAQHTYFTWRDTGILAKGALGDSPGAELAIVCTVIINYPPMQQPPCPGRPYISGQVPTIGLPILMEFRTFPDDGALGLNSFDINIAVNSSSRPNFRAFSTGGVNTNGVVIRKDPDLEPIATGGFNPASSPPGATTPGTDNTFYLGQLDLVLRISRVHSIFFDTGIVGAIYSTPVVEPRPEDQPAGTSTTLAFRGATTVTSSVTASNVWNAAALDPYGEPLPSVVPTTPSINVQFLNSDKTWKSTLPSINGAKFFQTRVTFLSNAESLLVPTLSALGIPFRAP
jgi:hypothetical protein